MPVNLEPEGRDALRAAIVGDLIDAISDSASAAEEQGDVVMKTLERLGVISVAAEQGADRVRMQITTDMDTVILQTTRDGRPDVRLTWTPAQARQVQQALPLHIEAAERYADTAFGTEP